MTVLGDRRGHIDPTYTAPVLESRAAVDVRARPGLQAGVLALPVVAYAVAAWAHRFVFDDGFIYLRAVHEVTRGQGPVFNIGQRVEVFTSPLWLGVLSVGDLLLPLRLEWIAVVLGIATTVGGLVCAILGSARLARVHEPTALLLPFGLLITVMLAPMWSYATGGLETGLAFLWLGLSFWLLARWATDTKQLSLWHAAVLGLGWLVRPELVLFTIAFLTTVLVLQWPTDTWKSRIRFLVAALVLPAVYQVFRMGYYGALVANTAIVKEGTRLTWSRGWVYITDFFGTYWFAIPAVIVVAGGYVPLARGLARSALRRGVWVLGAFLVASVVNATYIVAVGGDYLHAGLLLPAVFGFCVPIAVVPATRRYVVALAAAPWAVFALLLMRPPPFVLGSTYIPPVVARVTSDDARFGPERSEAAIVRRQRRVLPEAPAPRLLPSRRPDPRRRPPTRGGRLRHRGDALLGGRPTPRPRPVRRWRTRSRPASRSRSPTVSTPIPVRRSRCPPHGWSLGSCRRVCPMTKRRSSSAGAR